jgi:hypothetical protein
MADAGIDAGGAVDAPAPVAPSEPNEEPPAPSAAGCTVALSSGPVGTPWWLVPVLMLAGRMRKPLSSRHDS